MKHIYYFLVALPCTIGAIGIAILHIYKHLLNYTEPTYQRFIVRIIFMVPVYALMSFLSLIQNKREIYFNSIREMYEAWVIYNFLSLCLAWVGGPGAVVISLTGKVLKPNWCLMTCCFPPMPLDGRFIRRCKQGCLQFVFLKPVLVVVTLLLYENGKYEDGNFSPMQSFLYITIIYTISYSVALYALVLFYMACRDLLKPFNPVPKFVIIKSVVFLTYWQGRFFPPVIQFDCVSASLIDILVSTSICMNVDNHVASMASILAGVLFFLAAKSEFMRNTIEAADFQDFIICVEMLIAAIGLLYAFPYKEYAGANIGANRGFTASLAHALLLNDLYHDTVHQFAPTYHDYVLYNPSEGSDDTPRKYRSRTFVPTGTEMMESTRRSKSMIGSKLEDIELFSPSSSGSSSPESSHMNLEGVHASIPPLVDESDTVSPMFDRTLIDIDMSHYSEQVPAAVDEETETR